MATEASPEILKIVADLDARRTSWAADLTKFDQYVRGAQPLQFLSDEMRQEFGDKITELVINWPLHVVSAIEHRLDVEGFRYPEKFDGDTEMWNIWQANGMDEQSSLAHFDAVALSKAAAIVGADDQGAPIITVESAEDVSWMRDPRTRRVVRASKSWTAEDKSEWKTLYLPDETLTLTREGSWVVAQSDKHNMGRVPLVPLVNNPRIRYPDGVSEIAPVIGLADAANKMATDMMVSGEYHAMPRRWAFGLKREDFVDANGNLKSAWSTIKGRLWAADNKDVNVGQFPESDLKNFHDTIKLLAAMVVHLSGLPPYYLSFEGGNPTSADAIRSSEAPMVKRIERKQVHFGGAWEEVMRICLQVSTGSVPPEADRLETVWRDAATPTVAQRADAVMKLHAEGIIPTEQARIDLGYSPAQRKNMQQMDQAGFDVLKLNGPAGDAPLS